jgi:hypothetical protein
LAHGKEIGTAAADQCIRKVYKIASKAVLAVWPGEVEAPNGATASETVAAEGAGYSSRLTALRR